MDTMHGVVRRGKVKGIDVTHMANRTAVNCLVGRRPECLGCCSTAQEQRVPESECTCQSGS